MAILASPSALALPPASRTQLSILKPSTTLDSSDEARTDASASPSMNPERSPSATSSDTSVKDRKGKGASALSSSAKRRKEQTTSGPNEDKPAPKQRKYERKTKRFIWPDDLHRLFVAAIFDVGLKNASPKALLSLMEAAGPNAGLTTEHLKSHLQKYRLNYERSRAEFLEYYDRSAKRNLKRRRRQAQQRAGGASGDANTMFVFPISNSKHRKGDASDSDSDDSDSDGGDDNNNSMDVDAQGSGSAHATPRGQITPSPDVAEGHPRGLNYSQLMQSASVLGTSVNQRQPAFAASRLLSAVPTSISAGMLNLAPHHLPPGYTATSQAQRKQSSDHERELAAATDAAAAYRYPPGQVNIPVTSGIPELSDPQWSILNSLMSPQLTGMIGPGGEGAMFPHAPQVTTAGPTSEATDRDGSGSDGFMLHEEPTDMQLQMHLAMQAQMNLHRQMLTRKVEVAQHLARHSSMRAINTSGVSNSSNGGDAQTVQSGVSDSWNNAQIQQQQQQQYQQQQQQQQQYQQPVTLLPRPPLPAQPLATQPPATTTSASDTPSTTNVPTMPSTAAITGQPIDGPVAESAAGGLAAEAKSEDDAMDLYRWDRIDLNVGLDDDDLFGFLKA